MSHFFHDLWDELREKRLLPVALVLVLAIVAVPALLLKRGEEPEPAASAQAAAPDDVNKLAVQLADEPSSPGSGFDLFDGKDPFKPSTPKQRVASRIAARAGVSLSPDSGGGGASGRPGGSGAGGGRPSTRPRRTTYTYVADVTFGRGERTRSIRGLRRLDMLPDEDNPLLVFLGVDSSGDDAVFLVDSTLKQEGEGRCADKECSVLSIGAGSEHSFTDSEGREYALRIDHIRRVRAGASSSRRRSEASGARRGRSSERNRDLLDRAARADANTLSADRDRR